jgi:hypothetical protein
MAGKGIEWAGAERSELQFYSLVIHYNNYITIAALKISINFVNRQVLLMLFNCVIIQICNQIIRYFSIQLFYVLYGIFFILDSDSADFQFLLTFHSRLPTSSCTQLQ